MVKVRLFHMVLLVMALSLLSIMVFAQEEEDSFLSFHLTGGISLPLMDETLVFSPGAGGDFLVNYRLPFFPLLLFDAGVGYNYVPAIVDQDLYPGIERTLSYLHAEGGLGARLELFQGFLAGAFVNGGYFYGFVNEEPESFPGSGGYLNTGLDFTYMVTPSIGIKLAAAYRNFFGFAWDTMASLGISYHIYPKLDTGKALKSLELLNIEFVDVFPVFYKYYDNNPIGKAVIKNTGSGPINDIVITFYVKQFMDNPKDCVTIKRLDGGKELVVDIYGLFNENVLTISESTKVSANILIKASKGGKKYSNDMVQTLRIYDRNAIMWDDDRKAAAFVTAKEPTILKLSKFVMGAIKGKASPAINKNFLYALAMHQALTLYGMNYVVDPSTPYAEFSKQKMAVDFLQFPKQSLEFKAGDCDDLSILYCSLLESIGVETAFITAPGHIYAAVDLALDPQEARKTFDNPANLIFIGDKTWLPVEITSIDGGFVKAWQLGAREWQQFIKADHVKLFPLHDAWKIYEPVGFRGEEYKINLPSDTALTDSYIKELGRFVEKEIFNREKDLLSEIKKNQESPRARNKLGILYSRYGLNDKAVEQYNLILNKSEYLPAILNLANIYFLMGDLDKALPYYERALKLAPDNAQVILQASKAYYEAGNFEKTEDLFNQAKALDKGLAEDYAYLDLGAGGVARASQADMKSDTVWLEE